MKILLAASEAVPFCKTGGLADVVGALGQKLGAAGHDVCLFLPKYRAVEAAALHGSLAHPLKVKLGGGETEVSLRFMQWRSVSVQFVDYPPYFDREGLYGRDGRDHPDNDERYALFCRAVLEGAKAVGFKPDVIHVHDWQTAPIAVYLKRDYKDDPFFKKTACMLTVHNLAYQGNFPRAALETAGFAPEDFTPEALEYYGQVSYLKGGLVFADALTTVSPTYAREIQESGERGFGLEGLLRRRSKDLTGVLNGIDTDLWNPEKDSNLPRKYGKADAVAGKAACRKAVRAECGIGGGDAPLIGIVSRLDYQKGLDLAIAALEPRLSRCALVVVGTGDASLREAFSALARRHPGRVHYRGAFDDSFAHRVYAASDFFLMPSRFEPCGLGQMIALRYGCLPIVAKTGGLADTVREAAENGKPANGFVSKPGDVDDLGKALDRALDAYHRPNWPESVAAAMSSVYTWDASVTRYVELYRGAQAALKA